MAERSQPAETGDDFLSFKHFSSPAFESRVKVEPHQTVAAPAASALPCSPFTLISIVDEKGD